MRRAPKKNSRPRLSLRVDDDPPASRNWWVIVIILLSLLAHVLLVLAILLVVRHTPKPPELVQSEPLPPVTVTLQPPPPPPHPQQPSFIETHPEANAPKQDTPLISDNDNSLHSKNRTPRKQNSPLPDVTGAKHPSLDLHTTPASPPTKNPGPPSPPTPATQQQQPKPPTPAKPTEPTKPAPPHPEKTDQPSSMTPTATPLKTPEKPPVKPPQYDPNGLPVLPALDAATIAPQTPPTQQANPVQPRKSASPPPSFAVNQSDVSGQVGTPGDNSAAVMATDLGRYKARVYAAVGSRWYAKVNNQLQVLGLGTVHITYTIHSDGHLEITADPDKNSATLMLLHSVSINAMLEAAPFEPFSPALKKEVGESYSDDFTFSIYGN